MESEMKQLLLQEDFSSGVLSEGWSTGEEKSPPILKEYIKLPGKYCLYVPGGYCNSPLLPVKPFSYYRVDYFLKCTGSSYAAGIFYDDTGTELPSDHYTGADFSPDWTEQSFCFLGKASARHVRIRFRPIKEEMFVGSIQVSSITPSGALSWVESIYQRIPPCNFELSAETFRPLPGWQKTLAVCGTRRFVLLGDSVVNDISNSLFELLIQRHYPGLKIEVVSSTRSGGNCTYYGQQQHLSRHILQYNPDLLVIGGISHGGDTEPIKNLVEKVRRQSKTSILLLTGAFVTPERKKSSDYPLRLRELAEKQDTGFLDTEKAWSDYVARSNYPPEYFMRDTHHANERGKQVIARLLEKFFTENQ